jgi:hypothetical protein
MWLSLSDSYISIVTDPGNPDLLQVRARAARDLERLFPGAKVTRSLGADYVYCVSITRDAAGKALQRAIMRLEKFESGAAFDSERATAENRWRWHCGTCGAAGIGDPVSDSCPSCVESDTPSAGLSSSRHAAVTQPASGSMLRHLYDALMTRQGA